MNRPTGKARWSLLLLGLLLAGCGRSDFATVEGTVTVDGNPVEGIEITFEPQFAQGSSSLGITDRAGHYTAMFTAEQAGVMPGKHVVRINATNYDSQGNETVRAEIPPEYGDESTLELDVLPGSNTFNLDVKTVP